jgi:tetratricopeptide (TPR) repeat protein
LQVEFEAALKDYEAALELDNDLNVAKYNRGTIFYRMGKFDKALVDFEAAIEADKDNKDYQEALEKCKAEIK